MVVHCRVVPDRGDRQVGFVVARSVGGAVVRNRVRRRLRGVVVDLVDSLPQGADVVVRALPPAAEASFSRLAEDYRSALATVSRRATERVKRP